MLVEYSFGKYELAVVDKLFDALFVSAKLMVLQSVSPRSPKDLLVEAKKNERATALKEVKRLCKEFGFTAGMLKGALAVGRKKGE